MEYLYYYLIFALSGSIVSYFSILRPTIKTIKKEHPNNLMAKNTFALTTMWVLTTITLTPLFIPVLLSDKLREKFTISFIKGLVSSNA